MAEDLISGTRALLQASQTPWPQIAAGAGVSLRWLYQFAKGDGTNHTFRTVQNLNTYLLSERRKPSKAARELAPSS